MAIIFNNRAEDRGFESRRGASFFGLYIVNAMLSIGTYFVLLLCLFERNKCRKFLFKKFENRNQIQIYFYSSLYRKV
jgi:hypothetical protein